jgi:hypothetical protein
VATLFLAAGLCAAALGAVAVETDARVAARGREVRLEGASSGSTRELEVVPRLALLGHGNVELALSYAPRLTFPMEPARGTPEFASGSEIRDRGEIVHRGDLAARWRATPNLTLGLRADGASGRIDLGRSEIYVDEALPSGERLAWRSVRAAIDVASTPSRRSTLAAAFRAWETGGADERARRLAPLQRGVRLEGAARYAATRRDALAVLLDGSLARYHGDTELRRATLVRVAGGWTRALEPTLTARASSGAAWSSHEAALAGSAWELAPFVEAGLVHAPPRPAVVTEVALRSTPLLNPLTGGIDERLEASVGTRWRASGGWELAARTVAAAIRKNTRHGAFWSGERRAELASLDVRATWAFARRGSLSVGPWVRDQRSHDPTWPTFVEWGAALELAFGGRWLE